MKRYHTIVWRPFLTIQKDVIFSAAHHLRVPYFKDSTPSWSVRGRLRMQLLPLLREIYGDGLGSNLRRLAAEAAAAENLAEEALSCLETRIGYGEGGAWVECYGLEGKGAGWWREGLRRLCRKAGLPNMRSSTVDRLIEKLQYHNPKMRKISSASRSDRCSSAHTTGFCAETSEVSSQRVATASEDSVKQLIEETRGGWARGACGTWLQAGGDVLALLRGTRLFLLRPFLAKPVAQPIAAAEAELCSSAAEQVRWVGPGSRIRVRPGVKLSMRAGVWWIEVTAEALNSEVFSDHARQESRSERESRLSLEDVVIGQFTYKLQLSLPFDEHDGAVCAAGLVGTFNAPHASSASDLNHDAGGNGGDRHAGSSCYEWVELEMSPLARLEATRGLHRDVRKALPLLAVVGTPSSQSQERCIQSLSSTVPTNSPLAFSAPKLQSSSQHAQGPRGQCSVNADLVWPEPVVSMDREFQSLASEQLTGSSTLSSLACTACPPKRSVKLGCRYRNLAEAPARRSWSESSTSGHVSDKLCEDFTNTQRADPAQKLCQRGLTWLRRSVIRSFGPCLGAVSQRATEAHVVKEGVPARVTKQTDVAADGWQQRRRYRAPRSVQVCVKCCLHSAVDSDMDLRKSIVCM